MPARVAGIEHWLHPNQLQALRGLREEEGRGSGEPGVRHVLGSADPGHRLIVGCEDRDGDRRTAGRRAGSSQVKQPPDRVGVTPLGQADRVGLERHGSHGQVELVSEFGEARIDLGEQDRPRGGQV